MSTLLYLALTTVCYSIFVLGLIKDKGTTFTVGTAFLGSASLVMAALNLI